jgi:hypothetical protein
VGGREERRKVITSETVVMGRCCVGDVAVVDVGRFFLGSSIATPRNSKATPLGRLSPHQPFS